MRRRPRRSGHIWQFLNERVEPCLTDNTREARSRTLGWSATIETGVEKTARNNRPLRQARMSSAIQGEARRYRQTPQRRYQGPPTPAERQGWHLACAWREPVRSPLRLKGLHTPRPTPVLLVCDGRMRTRPIPTYVLAYRWRILC